MTEFQSVTFNPAGRDAAAFEFPRPRLLSRLASAFTILPSYEFIIDESTWQYTNGRSIDYVKFKAGGGKATVIRATDGLITDSAFLNGNWKRALDADLPFMLYANFHGNMSGSNQADYFLNAAKVAYDACQGHTAAWLDAEANTGDTATIATRQSSINAALSLVHGTYKRTGVYSNVAYWNTLYGNMKLPDWAFEWAAHWTGISNPTLPGNWTLAKLILWQFAVWDNYSWAIPVPGATPDIDEDRFMLLTTTVRDWLEWETPAPPPVEDWKPRVAALEALTAQHTSQIAALDANFHALNDTVSSHGVRITALENQSPPSNLPRFQVGASRANCRVQVGVNGTGKPILDIPPVGIHRIQFDAGQIILLVSRDKQDVDGAEDFYLVDPSMYPTGEPAQYIRASDGVLLP